MEPIRFSLSRVKPERLGSIVFNESVTFCTPGCMLYVQGGCVPHLTKENMERVLNKPWPLIVPLQSVYDALKSVEAFGKPLNEFCGFSAAYPVIMPIHEALRETPRGNNDKSGIAIWKGAGRWNLLSREFMQIISTFKPAAYQALTDGDTAKNCSKKRLSHSVKRSLNYLNQCLEIHREQKFKPGLLASIQGGFEEKSRDFFLHGTLMMNESEQISGYIIDGLHCNGESAKDLTYEDIEPVLKKTLEKLPENKPKFMFGAYTPDLVFKLAKAGVDCFDSSFASMCTDEGKALIFTFKDVEVASETPRFLQLNENHYRDDMQLISDECQCYTCTRKFTRAYINHLLLTKELLAYVLLQLHNLHHYLKFFENMREHFNK